MKGKYFLIVIILLLWSSNILKAESIYVDCINGNDKSKGTEKYPIATLNRAAEIVNAGVADEETIIRLAPGIYYMAKTAEFTNQRNYSEHKRLILEAAILPGDSTWAPDKMPVIMSIASPETYFFDNRMVTWDLKFEISHVTVCGLKFLGNPTPHNRHSSIRRHGKNLTDLLVTQCIFVGDMEALPLHLGIIANGHKTVVDHCIFYGCQNSVVFWEADSNYSYNNAMRYCIVKNNATSAVWTCMTANDFEFHHNIISGCKYFWMRQPYNKEEYKIEDCIVTNNTFYCGIWNLPENLPEDFKYMEKNVSKEGVIELILSTNRVPLNVTNDYLHIQKDKFGYNIGAGIFLDDK